MKSILSGSSFSVLISVCLHGLLLMDLLADEPSDSATQPMSHPSDMFKIEGLKVGQIQDEVGMTGCTVFLFENGAVVRVDVRGSAPGTRELALLEPGNLVEKVHAVVLSGGSAFGLDSMSGVAAYLEEQNIGYDTGVARVPIVTGAVLFDLAVGDPKIRPNFEMGFLAAKSANNLHFQEGNQGAGMGATAGKFKSMDYAMKGGIGSHTLSFENGLVVSAVVAVNALGDIYNGDSQIAGMLNADRTAMDSSESFILNGYESSVFSNTNTTIGIVITNASLTKAKAKKLAQATHNAFAKCIRPTHTLYDGDTIFAAATGSLSFDDMIFLSVAANRAMEKAIVSAIEKAESIGGFISAADFKATPK